LAGFERASDAVAAALAFQAAQTDHNTQLNDNIQPSVRVGIAMGEVIIADDTITGTGVVLAQRLEQLSKLGGVVIQGAAQETIPGRFPFEYEDLGECEVRGFEKPVRAYSVGLKSATGNHPRQIRDNTVTCCRKNGSNCYGRNTDYRGCEYQREGQQLRIHTIGLCTRR
jgi:class 3 adenylate cyclase